MKTLHLIRHAKSSWANPSLADIDRPLNKRGKKACQIMAEPIMNAGFPSTGICCSPARRAQATIEGIDKQLNQNLHWVVHKALYTFDWRDVLDWLQQQDNSAEELVIIGHNPALTDLCNALAGTNIDNIPTCAYAQLACDIEQWGQACGQCATLRHFIRPKDLG